MGLFHLLFGIPETAEKRSSNNGFITYDDSFFKDNDEDLDICEDMFADRNQNPEVDLEEQYGWENKLNYDSDGFSDEEDW